MGRLGFECDGCGDEYRHDPAAAVQDEDLNWYELCSDCYDDHLENGGGYYEP